VQPDEVAGRAFDRRRGPSQVVTNAESSASFLVPDRPHAGIIAESGDRRARTLLW
jgi:hypothetical protein